MLHTLTTYITKADKIILSDRQYILIEGIKNCKFAVQKKDLLLKLAVQQSRTALKHVKEQTEEMKN